MITNRVVHTYSHNAAKRCIVLETNGLDEMANAIRHACDEGTTFSIMGGGNSFGDVFLPKDHHVIVPQGLNQIGEIDPLLMTITVGAGVRSGQLMFHLLQQGYYLPACSGSMTNTVAGDISANVHGKDTWRVGHFYHTVIRIKLMTTSGTVLVIERDSDEFKAVVGGLGMIGVIVEATLRVIPVSGTSVSQKRIAATNLHDVLEIIRRIRSDESDFCHAWLDPLKSGSNCGRGIIESASFISSNSNCPVLSVPDSDRILGLSNETFWLLARNGWHFLQRVGLDRPTYRLINSTRYHWLANQRPKNTDFRKFQFPMLSAFPNWNLRFITRGMQEIQCSFGYSESEEAIRALWQILRRFGVYCELSTVRRHKEDGAFLSMACEGLSTTLNYDRCQKDDKVLYAMERAIVATVIRFKGRIYLAKFPYLKPDEFREMFPDHIRFEEIRRRLDPGGQIRTMASQRLQQTSAR